MAIRTLPGCSSWWTDPLLQNSRRTSVFTVASSDLDPSPTQGRRNASYQEGDDNLNSDQLSDSDEPEEAERQQLMRPPRPTTSPNSGPTRTELASSGLPDTSQHAIRNRKRETDITMASRPQSSQRDRWQAWWKDYSTHSSVHCLRHTTASQPFPGRRSAEKTSKFKYTQLNNLLSSVTG